MSNIQKVNISHSSSNNGEGIKINVRKMLSELQLPFNSARSDKDGNNSDTDISDIAESVDFIQVAIDQELSVIDSKPKDSEEYCEENEIDFNDPKPTNNNQEENIMQILTELPYVPITNSSSVPLNSSFNSTTNQQNESSYGYEFEKIDLIKYVLPSLGVCSLKFIPYNAVYSASKFALEGASSAAGFVATASSSALSGAATIGSGIFSSVSTAGSGIVAGVSAIASGIVAGTASLSSFSATAATFVSANILPITFISGAVAFGAYKFYTSRDEYVTREKIKENSKNLGLVEGEFEPVMKKIEKTKSLILEVESNSWKTWFKSFLPSFIHEPYKTVPKYLDDLKSEIDHIRALNYEAQKYSSDLAKSIDHYFEIISSKGEKAFNMQDPEVVIYRDLKLRAEVVKTVSLKAMKFAKESEDYLEVKLLAPLMNEFLKLNKSLKSTLPKVEEFIKMAVKIVNDEQEKIAQLKKLTADLANNDDKTYFDMGKKEIESSEELTSSLRKILLDGLKDSVGVTDLKVDTLGSEGVDSAE